MGLVGTRTVITQIVHSHRTRHREQIFAGKIVLLGVEIKLERTKV